MEQQQDPDTPPMPDVRVHLRLLWRLSAAVILLFVIGGTFKFQRMEFLSCRESINVYPLDAYFYSSYAVNILDGLGPQANWPEGPRNKYFPGFAYWWAMFLDPGWTSLEAVNQYVPAQLTVNFLLMISLCLLGKLLWNDWILGLGFAALTSASPVLLKWSSVPMAEPLACLCVTLFAIFSVLAWQNSRLAAAPNQKIYLLALAGMALAGAAGFFTRMEVMFVIGTILLVLTWLRRIHWALAMVVLGVCVLPVAIWQAWVFMKFGQESSYVAEGQQYFDKARMLVVLQFLIECFVRVYNVKSAYPFIDLIMLLAAFVYFASLVAGLRGYLGRVPLLCAWMCLVYWCFHALWYYEAERYNLIVLPFGYTFFFEGLGRLYSWRNGWKARGSLIFLLLICLLFVPYFRWHGDMATGAHNVALNQQVLPK